MFLPTRRRQKSTGTDMEQNYVTVTLCRRWLSIKCNWKHWLSQTNRLTPTLQKVTAATTASVNNFPCMKKSHNSNRPSDSETHLTIYHTVLQPQIFKLTTSSSVTILWLLFNSQADFQTGRANLHKLGLTQSPSCDFGQRQTMNHIVDTCPLTKFKGGLNLLHKANNDAVMRLESTATAALVK